MKAHTSDLKNNIKLLGRELSSKITYELNGETIELGDEQLNSITPHYKSALLKSVMKQLDIDSNVEIPEGTVINYQEGIKVGNSYEYLNYGNYVVYSIEKQEDKYSYTIKCYDKMLYTMKDYESMQITYPITVRDFINAICNKVGLTFKNANEQFVNYNKEIPAELYISTDGRSLGYTFRDVLDELAEVTASNICINEEDDELEIRYVKDVGELTNVSGADLTLETDSEVLLDNFELEGKTTQATRSGKNLLNVANTTTTTNGMTFTKNNDNSITLNGTTTANTFYNLNYTQQYFVNFKNGKSYTMSVDKALPHGISITTRRTNPNQNLMTISYNAKEAHYTANADYSTFTYLYIPNGYTFNNYKLYIQIEEGTQATSYEQYGAMPSPDYPSELVSVGYENLFNSSTFVAGDVVGANANIRLSSRQKQYITAGTYTFSTNLDLTTYNYDIAIIPNTPPSTSYTDLYNSGWLTTNTKTITLNVSGYLCIYLRKSDNSTLTVDNISSYWYQFEKSTQHSYISYGKYGIEVKTTGKNLFDNQFRQGNADTTTIAMRIYSKNNYYLKAGTYTLSTNLDLTTLRYAMNLNDNPFPASGSYYDSGWKTINSYTFTAPRDSYFGIIVSYINGANITPSNIENYYFQLEKGTQKTTYEEYKSNTYTYTLDQPLRSIGDTKDLLYIKNGMLYVDRKIGSVVLDGSENWERANTTQSGKYRFFLRNASSYLNNAKFPTSHYQCLNLLKSNLFIPYGNGTSPGDCIEGIGLTTIALNQFGLYANITSIMSVNDFKTWLSINNTEVQYILAEPYTEELGSVETPSTYEGITYLNAPNTTNVSYVSEIDTIDEEYLKDVNVNFGEKFGPVNTIILSRSGGSDKITQSIPEDITDENKIAIEISENQIMNDNNRADFIPEILNQLKGIEYYINDYTSTGICYLNLCDRYRVKVFDNNYKCIMLNDEVNKTQGLEESIYAEKPEETNTEYKHTSTDDRKMNQTYIIAKKNEGTIEEVTQKIIGDNGLEARVGRVETTQTATERTINVISENITYQYDEQGNPISSDINSVKTTTGFTFNADGLTIADSQTNFIALHDNTGTYYKEGNEVIGQYTKDGSKQKDLQLFGVYYYGMSDINDTPMFVAQLYTDENGNEAFGHFYNRGD